MISPHQLRILAESALRAAGASAAQAAPTAHALVRADAQGLASHGVARIPMYCAHLRHRRVDGNATPRILKQHTAAALIDAADGFAYPACELAAQTGILLARKSGAALATVTHSHHFGAAALLLDSVAKAGLVGVAMGNSPAAMTFPGGMRAMMGTNPLAAVFPRSSAGGMTDPVVIDLSMSEVARGKILLAAKANQPIPEGWALDGSGQPTTNAQEALKGSMLPFGSARGGVKGAMLALMIELMVISLTGARFGAEADSFFEDEGNKPRIGQVFIVIDPAALAGSATYEERVEALLAAVLSDGNTRLPGARRFELERQTEKSGLAIPAPLLEQIRQLASQSMDLPG